MSVMWTSVIIVMVMVWTAQSVQRKQEPHTSRYKKESALLTLVVVVDPISVWERRNYMVHNL
eukprot:3250437-Pyramimonas_sp.AAC.1